MDGEQDGAAGHPRLPWMWRIGLAAAYLVGLVLLFGPISAATGPKDPPWPEMVVQIGITLGMIAGPLLAIAGRKIGLRIGIWSSIAGVGIGLADVPQVGDVGLAELVLFGVLLLGTLVARQRWTLIDEAVAEYRALHPEPVLPSVELRSFRISRKRPQLTIDGRDLVIFVPSYFGPHEWRVPIEEVTVSEHLGGRRSKWDQGFADALVFEKPPVLPFLMTTTKNAQPNLLLLFANPTETPVPRRFVTLEGQPRRRPFWSGPQAGATVDGVMLRCTSPPEAVRTLSAAGVETTYSPEEWLAHHRKIVTDEAKREEVLGRRRSIARVQGIAAMVTVPLWIIMTILRFTAKNGSNTALIAFGVICAVMIATFGLVHWRVRRLSGPD